jgi:fatty acid desaturase
VEIKPPKDLVSNDELKAWALPDGRQLFLDLLQVWAQIAISLGVALLFPSPGVYLIAMIFVAGAQNACAMIAHEGAHYLLVPQNRVLNDRLSAWLFAAPIGLPFSTYRQRHLDHHRFVSTEKDTKDLYRRRFRGWRLLAEVVRSLLGWDFLSQIANTMRSRAASPGKSAAKTPRKSSLPRDLVAIAACQLLLLGVFSLVDWRLYFGLWLLPIVTFSQLFSKLRSAVEHQPLDSEVPTEPGLYFKGTEKPFLRSVEATPLECLLLSRLNFHYHAEHHLWPQVGYQHLPVLHQRLQNRKDFHGVTFEGSYCSVIWKLARGQ